MDGDFCLFRSPFAETGDAGLEGSGSSVRGVFVDEILVGDAFGSAVACHGTFTLLKSKSRINVEVSFQVAAIVKQSNVKTRYYFDLLLNGNANRGSK